MVFNLSGILPSHGYQIGVNRSNRSQEEAIFLTYVASVVDGQQLICILHERFGVNLGLCAHLNSELFPLGSHSQDDEELLLICIISIN